jgi:uncharacterized protein YgbK (DUF1537 family)
MPPLLRLLADDLTGALDTGAVCEESGCPVRCCGAARRDSPVHWPAGDPFLVRP